MILTLQTSTFSAYGGIPTYNRLVCRALNEFGVANEKRVLVATDELRDIESPTVELSGLSLEAYARKRAAFVRRVLSLAINQRIDLALIGHVNYAPLGLLLKRLQPQLRYGVMMHGVDVWTRLSYMRRYALQQAAFSVSVSEYTRRQAVKFNGAMEERVHLLPNAIEWDAAESATTASVLPAPPGTRLLTVCRLDETERYKGVDTVIEALPSLIAQVPDAQYLIVGSGGDMARLKKLAEVHRVAGRVHFLGSVDEATLRACYRTCDVFVMPSAKEGFGIVFLEAMQYSKPVVAADSGGSPEVVQDEVTGLLVHYGNIPQLAQALIRLCLDPEQRLKLGRAGYQRLQEHFTFSQFVRTFTEILVRELPATAIYRGRCRALTAGLKAA